MMLPTQTNSGIHIDILPTQNIGVIDQNQPQIYSLLQKSSSPSSMKQNRRKKATKLDETMPVMINPQITRIASGLTFIPPHLHRSTIPIESISSLVPPNLINGTLLPFRFYFESNAYDANNNINHDQIPSISRSLNPPFPIQTQNTSMPAWSNELSLPTVNINSMPPMVTKSPYFGINRLLNNNINERAMSVSAHQHNEHHLSSLLTSTEQGSVLSHSHSTPTSLSSISTTNTPAVKPKRKYTRRSPSSASVELQQQISPVSSTKTQSIVFDGLPSVIPASLSMSLLKADDHPLPIEIPTTSSFLPLTPPSSIKSPPTNIHNEPSPNSAIQQHLLPHPKTNISEVNPISKSYFSDQGFLHAQQTINDLSSKNLSYNVQQLLAPVRPHYCLIPSNILPMTCSSVPSETIPNTPSMPISDETNKERKKREKNTRQTNDMQKPTIEKNPNVQSLVSKSQPTNVSSLKNRKPKKSTKKDARIKNQLRRMMDRHRLAIVKFMIKKRKYQKQQQPISIPKVPQMNVQEMLPKLATISKEKTIPDIIAPSLKISFDANQRVESISLYYHRRRKPDTSLKPLPLSDNRLDLLAEAVELLETLNGNLKSKAP